MAFVPPVCTLGGYVKWLYLLTNSSISSCGLVCIVLVSFPKESKRMSVANLATQE